MTLPRAADAAGRNAFTHRSILHGMEPMTRRPAGLDFDAVARLAQRLPEVEVGTSYGTPALKVKKKLFARLWEDGETLVLKLSFVVRDHLIASEPDVFFLTDHYRNYPYVLVRLPRVTKAKLAPLLEESWRQVAPTRLQLQLPRGKTS
jgi:hypothetical protein